MIPNVEPKWLGVGANAVDLANSGDTQMKMKNVMLALALAACVSGKALAETANAAPHPLNTAGSVEGLTYQGVKKGVLPASSSGKLIHTGPGFLDAICPFFGAAGTYTLAYDEADGGEFANGLTASNNLSYALTPAVFTVGAYTAIATGEANVGGYPGMRGCFVPPAPIKFVNGLYAQGNGGVTGHTTIFYLHCSDGSNPCSMP